MFVDHAMPAFFFDQLLVAAWPLFNLLRVHAYASSNSIIYIVSSVVAIGSGEAKLHARIVRHAWVSMYARTRVCMVYTDTYVG